MIYDKLDEILGDNKIIIGPSYLKKDILSKYNLKYNIKYFNMNELKDLYLYKYKENTLVYIDSKYNLIPEVGNIILDALYNVDIYKEYNTIKLDMLAQIKKDLIENEYIIFDKHIKSYLSNKDIIVIDGYYDSTCRSIIEEIKNNNKVTICKQNIIKKDKIDVYEFDTLEEELIFVATSIKKLIDNGVSLNKIKINKLDRVYKAPFNRIFNFYNIPYELESEKLYYLDDIKLFLKNIDDNTKILDINSLLKESPINDKVKDKLVTILNKYTDYTYVKEIKNELIYELRNTSITFDKYSNIITYIDYKNYKPNDSEYIFIVGFNQDKIPMIHKDDKYLSDEELVMLNSDTSLEKNNLEKEKLSSFINNTKNITLSYKLSSNFEEFSVSNYIKDLGDTVNIIKDNYDYKNEKVNKLMLSCALDNYIKYNVVSDNLDKLYSSYKDIDYMTYDNSYKKINKDTIKKQLNNKINLSFSNTNTFFKCKFRFLLDTIYKLAPYEETISQKIGTLFHDVLCIVYKEKREDYDAVITDVIDKMYPTKTKKEEFYLNKYRIAIKKLINILNDEMSNSDYENTYFEEWFSIEKPGDLEINIVGKIDKILTFKDGINTYVIVIDYKTGSLHNDFNKVIYGLDMQLLYYLYLIKHTDRISSPKFTGMYLQSIMTEVLANKKNVKYENQVIDNMRLNGYTTSNLSELYHIDHNYNENSFIKGIKVKNDGTFYSYSKVFDNELLEELLNIVDNNISDVIKSIETSSFEINPKKIGDKNEGCEYCPFGDICYKNDDNIVELKEYKNLEFLGGDDDDTN